MESAEPAGPDVNSLAGGLVIGSCSSQARSTFARFLPVHRLVARGLNRVHEIEVLRVHPWTARVTPADATPIIGGHLSPGVAAVVGAVKALIAVERRALGAPVFIATATAVRPLSRGSAAA